MAADYLLLFRLDRQASVQALHTASSGAQAQREHVAKLGGEVRAQWGLLGKYDLAALISFPSPEHAIAYSLISNAAGFYVETHLVVTPHQLEEAKRLAFSESGSQPSEHRDD